jgi:hypothetical protein
MDGETVLRGGLRNGSQEAPFLGGRHAVRSLKQIIMLQQKRREVVYLAKGKRSTRN